MNCKFLKVWSLDSSDGYTSKPVAYFSSIDQAILHHATKHKGNVYLSVSSHSYDAIQVEDKIYLLGSQIDLDHAEEKKREALINYAKSKLSAEELAALLHK